MISRILLAASLLYFGGLEFVLRQSAMAKRAAQRVEHAGHEVRYYHFQRDGKVFEKYGVDKVPTFVVLDDDGKPTWRHEGYAPAAVLRRKLR